MRLRSGDARKQMRGARKRPKARRVKVSKVGKGQEVVKDRRGGVARAHGRKAKGPGDFQRYMR